MPEARKPSQPVPDTFPTQALKLVTMFRDIESPEHREQVLQMVEAYIAALKERSGRHS